MASIGKIITSAAGQFTHSIKKNADLISNGAPLISDGSKIITDALDGLANCKRPMVNFAKWDYSSLISIPSEVRLKHLVKADDVLLSGFHPRSDIIQDPWSFENSALGLFQKGRGICNGLMQAEFDEKSKNFTISLWEDIRALDNLIEEAPPLKEDCIVYRGLMSESAAQTDFVLNLKEGMIIPHQTYTACATKITPYTKLFLADSEHTLVGMRIKLPKGTKGLLLRNDRDEFVLPRGAQIKINSIDKKNGIINAEYILPAEKPTIPDNILQQLPRILSHKEILEIIENKSPKEVLRYLKEQKGFAKTSSESLQYDSGIISMRAEIAILRKCLHEKPARFAEIEKIFEEIDETCLGNKEKFAKYKEVLSMLNSD